MATQSINVADLDGENGFALVGTGGSNFSGTFVSNAGDVNGDGFDDVLVSGRYSGSYVVFGKVTGFDATLNLSSLDGANGFRLDGGSYRSGRSVSNAGDVNGDGFDDLIVGTPGANPDGINSGSSYVVFGKAAGFDAAMNLADLDGSNGFRLDGVSEYDQSGDSVSGAGDVNGDGIDDVIISAPYANYRVGASYVVFGKSSGFDATMNLSDLDGNNGFRLDGAARSVSSGGDMNGDGFDDVIVSYDSQVHYVAFGKASGFDAVMNLHDLDGSSGLRLYGGNAEYVPQGFFARDAGDVNGDGFGDVIIGNATADLNGRDSGSSYVVFGRASGFDATMNLSDLDGNNGFRLDGATIDDRSGSSVSGAGDVNGDGFDDLIIGVPSANPDGSVTGSSYVIFGRASGFDAAMSLSGLDGDNNGFRIDGAIGDSLGRSVNGAGDVNGDGFDDLIVGAPYADSNGRYSGSSYIIFGRSEFIDGGVDFPATPEVRPTTTSINLSSLDGSNGFRLDSRGYYLGGFSISSAGDMNGDGFGDMVIGASFEKYYGESYVVFGKASGFDATIDLSQLDGKNGFRAEGSLQNYVESVGDINGDGFDDVSIVTGSSDYYYGNVIDSRVYVVFGNSADFSPRLNLSELDGSNGFHLADETPYADISDAGDVNGDGLDDFIIGKAGADPNGNNSGSSYVVFGKTSGFDATLDITDLDGSNGFRLDGAAENDFLGASVSGAGDINGDGFDDVIVGASGADPHGNYSGSSYVVFGKTSGFDATMNLSDLDGSNGFRLDGEAERDQTSNVSAAGDVNGDGFNDVLVSGRYSGGYVVFGKATGFDAAMSLSDLDGSNGFHLDGAGLFISASTAGDVNGDGFDDLIIGNSRADPNGYGSGSSYVMFGKSSGFDAEIKLSDLDSTNSIRLDGAETGDRSGRGVSAAGDVNSDGFDDLMVAAPDTDVNNDNSGSIYVIFGASQFEGVVTYVGVPENNDVLTGTAAAERFDPSDGNDLLIGGGGADVIYGGLDDDTIRVPDLDFQLVDGGSGNDTLELDGSGMSLDLANFQDKISDIETIDLGNAGDNMLTLTLQDVLNLSDATDTLIVKGDKGDRVVGLSSGWVDNGIQSGFRVFTQANAELLIANAVDTDFVANGNINLSTLNGINGFRLDGGYYGSGPSVSNAGDVNGDGFDDVIIGAPYADPNGRFSGSSYVVFGKAAGFDATMNLSELNGINGFRLDGVTEGDGSGASVSNAGDVNGDGFDDMIISAPIADSNDDRSDSSYVVFGKASGFDAAMNLSDLDGVNGFHLYGEGIANYHNMAVSSAGDVNGDGFDDVIIAAPGFLSSNSGAGASYVVFGKASGFEAAMNLSDLDGSDGFRLEGLQSNYVSVSDAGDVNGDGFDDVIIGASFASVNVFAGSSFVVFGKSSGFDAIMSVHDLDGSNGFRLDGVENFEHIGASVSNAGDVNGDGFDDLIVGSDAFRGNYSTYVVFGKSSGFDATISVSELDGSNGFQLEGSDIFDQSMPVSTAGDFNGDGFDDLIIGASRGNNDVAGASYVMFGKASGFSAKMSLSELEGSNGFRLDGSIGDQSGFSVSGAGDVNGDGLDDLIVGAPGADFRGLDSGSSYVVFGRRDFAGGEVDFPGTPGDDIFTGTSAAESFKGEAGNDRMIGRGGADSFDGGAGNDYIRILGDDFELVDGGTGTDILGLAGSGFNLDLSSVQGKIHGIETISLYGVGDNTLTLTAADVLGLSDSTDTLKIKGNAGDSVVGLSSGWVDGGVHGNFHTYTQGDAVLLIGVGVTTDFV